MNKLINRILAPTLVVAAAALAAIGSSGCATRSVSVPGTNGTNIIVTTKVPDVQQMCVVAKSAAYLGVEVWLRGIPPSVPGHPDDLKTIILVRNSLQTMIAAGNFNPADLTAALRQLPVNELKGAQGELIIGEAVILWDEYGQQLASLDKSQVVGTYLVPVAQAIVDGLNMAIGPSQVIANP